ncbi:MAG TPA: metal-dependent hydrolase [Acidimicrobiia bacterium]|nr:metal-dependent hydrolase [Acidimicrobiia bacterium]
MVLWYVGLAAVSVWIVFRDPRIDYRFLAVGSLLPLLVDLPVGERAYGHSLLVAVGLLFLVVAVTAGRRPARPRLLMLPIGMLLHVAFDGMWSHPETFWWPFLGGDARAGSLVPPFGTLVLREVVGLAALAWFTARFSLTKPGALARLWRTGRVEVSEA